MCVCVCVCVCVCAGARACVLLEREHAWKDIVAKADALGEHPLRFRVEFSMEVCAQLADWESKHTAGDKFADLRVRARARVREREMSSESARQRGSETEGQRDRETERQQDSKSGPVRR